MEDFGYQRDNIQNKFSDLSKRVFLIAATLFSISCFIYVTISAYHFIYQEEDSNIEIIHAKKGKIKIIAENDKNTDKPMLINNSIYEDIFGNKNAKKEPAKTKIRNIPKPAIPPKSADLDRRLIKNSTTDNKQQKKASTQKIIVYSDNDKKRKSAKDLLTKTDGKKRKTITNTKKPQKRAVRVQIAAMTSKRAAQKNWNKHNKRYPKLFTNLKPFIQEVNLGKRGIFFRLQIGNFYNQVEAEEFCNRYIVKAQKSRADCIVVE